ncbi:hypothetical protein AY599_27905 [Leptolyngbya valderiana BDU 20041]|nr:hypothetical protein AY599_27905 [Leptolyngbya valderiana BDU 20041]
MKAGNLASFGITWKMKDRNLISFRITWKWTILKNGKFSGELKKKKVRIKRMAKEMDLLSSPMALKD